MVMEEQQQQPKLAPANRPCAAAAALFKSSKKNTKPKKIPQRGLGVAQLEKLRFLEGLQMNGGGGGVPASSPHGFRSPVEPRDASAFFIRPPKVHDLLLAASFNEQQQQQHRPPPPPPPPLAIFPTFWNADYPQTIPIVNHRTEPPSNQIPPWPSHLAGVCSSANEDVRDTTKNTENGSFLSLGLVPTPNSKSIDDSQDPYSGNGSSPLNRRSFYNFFPLDGDIDLDLKL